jgi:hypothetical protein
LHYHLAQDHYGDVQNEEVGDDHDQYPSNPAFVSHHKVESGVKDERLTSDHAMDLSAIEHDFGRRLLLTTTN